MAKLKDHDAEITELLAEIEVDGHEHVTFRGQRYSEKIRTDYTELLYSLQQERFTPNKEEG